MFRNTKNNSSYIVYGVCSVVIIYFLLAFVLTPAIRNRAERMNNLMNERFEKFEEEMNQ